MEIDVKKETEKVPIQISQEELWGFNALNSQVANAMAEAKRLEAARDSYIKLLEGKYGAVFNPVTGQLEPESKTEKTKDK